MYFFYYVLWFNLVPWFSIFRSYHQIFGPLDLVFRPNLKKISQKSGGIIRFSYVTACLHVFILQVDTSKCSSLLALFSLSINWTANFTLLPNNRGEKTLNQDKQDRFGVVSIGSFSCFSFCLLFVPLEYIPNIPPHFTYVIVFLSLQTIDVYINKDVKYCNIVCIMSENTYFNC